MSQSGRDICQDVAARRSPYAYGRHRPNVKAT